ncbi:RNA recognition motif domain-containing protein [Laspinema olomoucense]|uniref:RNA-binding protein n=1 Tax=Laspinema olomoucense D3b TaxID=2953688 RepID=A0ABT2N5B8_9CYAN|nr:MULTISPECIES: RNA-binding protein [unclassified Laspinema]MCT7972414.1 RNA-binding protein [Laspinema sp. D3d]MCT7977889.1 RNA-binding protein [Laspinema sp. D3b]MCT7994337.1 RNA-binding protein [Laspinema sp. D3c]
MSIRLYIGNLPKEVDRKELQDVFAEAGDSVTTKVITDRKTGKCRGFGFVTVKNDEQADEFIEKFNGYMFQDTPLKIEKALPRKKGKGDEEQEGAPTSQTGEATETTSTPTPTPAASKVAKPTTGGGGGGARGNKSKRATGSSNSSSSGSQDSESVQPDPRWAGELEKLKQMLAAQASNS